MKTFRLIPAILIVAATVLAALQESTPVQSAHVTARLVSETGEIIPGTPFTFALRLDMEEGWHTYADPSGDAGMPTKITWPLPEGFRAGEIQWPRAKDFNLGPLRTRGYDGTVVLPVAITPPAVLKPGSSEVVESRASSAAPGIFLESYCTAIALAPSQGSQS